MSTAHPQPLPVAECDYTREIVKQVRPGDRGYQSVTEPSARMFRTFMRGRKRRALHAPY